MRKRRKAKPRASPIKAVIAGLGNPGGKYSATRHNIGFRLADLISEKWNGTPWETWASFHFSEVAHAGIHLHLLKPQTYMNLSGLAVKDSLEKWRVLPESLIVLHDDLDLPLGKIRIRPEGGHGGHNGVRSIMGELQTGQFTRIKLGIGRPAEGVEIVDHVLGEFLAEEVPTVEETLQSALGALDVILTQGVAEAMNRYNG